MSNDEQENELDKLRKTIEEFRAKAERSGSSSEDAKFPDHRTESQTSFHDSGIWSSPPSYPPPQFPPNRQCGKFNWCLLQVFVLCSMQTYAFYSEIFCKGGA